MSLLQMSVSGAVMILAVTVIRALTIHHLPKQMFPVLWGVVLARLLLPFSLPSVLSIYSLLEKAAPLLFPAKDTAPAFLPGAPVGQVTARSASENTALPLHQVIWACGVLICGLVFAVAYIRCCREFRASLPVQDGFAVEWLQAHPLARGLSIRQSDRFSAPLTYGIRHPVILLPKAVSRENTHTLQYVLAHEYVHIRRFDSVTKLFLIAAVCIHWFNPLVWAMYILANRDMELSCDEMVVRLFGEQEKAAYARALIRMEETRSGLTPLCSSFSKNATEERITAIMKMKKATIVSVVAACLLVLGTATAFATSAQPDAPAPQDIDISSEMCCSILSYVNEEDGTVYISLDGGGTYQPMTEEELQKNLKPVEVEWWTYDEYKAWLEQEKVQLQSMIGEKGSTGGRGDFIWTQEIVDETIAGYEEILEEIKNGAMVSRSVDGVDGEDQFILSYNPEDVEFSADDVVVYQVNENNMPTPSK